MAEDKKQTVENKIKPTPKQTLIQIVKFVAFSLGAGIIQVVPLRCSTRWRISLIGAAICRR